MFKKLLLISVIVSMLPFALMAQSTGKIVGQISDEATGEPLPGVNVTVDNTLLGANTDFDGYFVILNVPVGGYTVRASFIGFQEVAVEEVRVSAGITTDVNFQLKETPLELDEVIVITGARPLVEKNITQSYSLVNAEQIESIPVRGTNAILNLQASVVVQDGNVHIRGGRGNETGYYLDGASIVNPISNQRAVHIIQDAVEELQVLAGGYTAEFGGANSGIVRSELKTGTSDYHFSLDVQTDNFVDNGKKFLDTYSYGESIIAGTVSGPIMMNNIRFFLAGENWYTADNAKRFSEAIVFNDLVDTEPRSADVAAGHPDTVSLNYLPGYTPRNDFNQYSLNGTLLFDFKPIQFRISGVYTFSDNRASTNPMQNMLNSRQLNTTIDHLLLTGKLTYVFSGTSFLDVKASYFQRSTETEDPWFGTDWRKWADSLAISDYTNGEVQYRDRWLSPFAYRLLGIQFNREGTAPGNYVTNDQSYIGGNVDFVTQANKYNEVKIGGEVRLFTTRRYSINPLVMEDLATYGSEEAVPDAVMAERAGNIYGYDYWGNEINSGFNGPREPVFGSFYVQDKIEFKDLIINAGLRLDYFDTDDKVLRDPTDPVVDSETNLIAESEWSDKDPVTEISPRLGVSFPISQKTVFYAQYGKFIQMPELDNIYYNNRQLGRQIVTGGFFYLAPIGFAMDPMKTTQYEIGFRQQLGEVAAIDITGFYKNVKGYPTTVRVPAAAGADIQTYYAITNGDFATTKGLEFKLNLRRTNRLQAQLNYTLTSAEGTGSGESTYYGAVYRGSQVPTITSPLDFEQTHRGSVILDYRWGVNDGGPVLERLGANMVFSFNSGHPYTYAYAPPGGQADAYTAGVDYMNDPRSREALEPVNSSLTPWNFNMDLRLDKSFNIIENLVGTFYIRVTNVLNNKNVINVYQNTGSAVDDGYISDPSRYASNVQAYGPEYLDLYRAINTVNGASYLSQIGNELYNSPRQIFVGLKLTY
jgi:hypothetical protein